MRGVGRVSPRRRAPWRARRRAPAPPAGERSTAPRAWHYAWLLTRRRYTPPANRPSPNPAASHTSKPVNGSVLPEGSWAWDDVVGAGVELALVAAGVVVVVVGVTDAEGCGDAVDVGGGEVDVEPLELLLLLLWWCVPPSGSMYC